MNNFNIGGTIADDKWVYKWLQITPTALASKGSYVLDLVAQGYLPKNDNYDYELLLSAWIWTVSDAAGRSGNLVVYSGANTSARPLIYLLYAITRVEGYNCIQGHNCIMPLLNGNKTLCFYNGHSYAYSSWGIQLAGYRRLGTNV